MPKHIYPESAIDVVVRSSRLFADSLDPEEIYPRLADASVQYVRADGAAAFQISPEGGIERMAARNVAQDVADFEPETLTWDLGDEIIQAVETEYSSARTLLLVSGGRLFGALVLFYRADQEALSDTEARLADGLVELAAMSLDKAYQYQELLQVNAELRESRETLARTEQLRVLGQMAAVVAHEVKNPLASIAGVLQVIGGRLPGDSRDRKIMASVLDRVTSLNQLVDDLLVFARPQAPTFVELNVRALLRNAVAEFRSDPASASVEVDLNCPDRTITADMNQLHQVLSNLLINAGQAMDGEGRIEVSCEGLPGACRIRVSDTGPGIPQETLDSIFEPFFTTKSRGSGLGLTVAKRVIEDHGGRIQVESEAGEGTTFVITLPLEAGRPLPG
ncbi:MAG: ATP-binding protein [Myxococcota bacterium]